MKKKIWWAFIISAIAAFSIGGYFYWQKLGTAGLFSSISDLVIQESQIPSSPAPSLSDFPPLPSISQPAAKISATPIKLNPLPVGKIVVAKEIALIQNNPPPVEQISPQDQKIPSSIIEEKSPKEAILPLPPMVVSVVSSTPVSSSLPSDTDNQSGGGIGGESDNLILSATSTPETSTSTPSVSTSTSSISTGVTIFLSNYQITSRQFAVNWQSSTSVAVFDLQQKQNTNDWQPWISATTSTSTLFSVPQDNSVYYFRVRASQTATSSVWQEISAFINWQPIVINEIAWAGTGTSSKASRDEWLELFNKTEIPIDLSGWKIVKGVSSGTASTTLLVGLKGIINPKSYYLIERGGDDAIINIAADLTSSWGDYGLSNSGEDLELVDASNQLVDEVDATNGWPFGTAKPDYTSMERVNPYLAADVPGNWQSNSTSTRNGLNVAGQSINGTPKAQNSVFSLKFFYLYPAQNITASSTILNWTPGFLPGFKEYRVVRSLAESTTTPDTVNATTSNSFFDSTLESETEYSYKILACDNLNNCVASNTISIKTPEFPFSWAEPVVFAGIPTSTPATAFELSLDATSQPLIVWLDTASSSPDISSSTGSSNYSTTVLNQNNEPYNFWIATTSTASAIYFNFKGENQLVRMPQKIFEFPYEIKKISVVISPNNIIYFAWPVESENKIYYTFLQVE